MICLLYDLQCIGIEHDDGTDHRVIGLLVGYISSGYVAHLVGYLVPLDDLLP